MKLRAPRRRLTPPVSNARFRAAGLVARKLVGARASTSARRANVALPFQGSSSSATASRSSTRRHHQAVGLAGGEEGGVLLPGPVGEALVLGRPEGAAPGVLSPTARPAAASPVRPRPVPARATAAMAGRGRRATSVPKRPRALLNDTGSSAARPPSGARISAAWAAARWEAEPAPLGLSPRWAGRSRRLSSDRSRGRCPLPLPSVCWGRHPFDHSSRRHAQEFTLPVGVVHARPAGRPPRRPSCRPGRPDGGRCRRCRPATGRCRPPRPARRCLRTRPGPPGPAPGAGRSGRGGRRAWRRPGRLPATSTTHPSLARQGRTVAACLEPGQQALGQELPDPADEARRVDRRLLRELHVAGPACRARSRRRRRRSDRRAPGRAAPRNRPPRGLPPRRRPGPATRSPMLCHPCRRLLGAGVRRTLTVVPKHDLGYTGGLRLALDLEGAAERDLDPARDLFDGGDLATHPHPGAGGTGAGKRALLMP